MTNREMTNLGHKLCAVYDMAYAPNSHGGPWYSPKEFDELVSILNRPKNELLHLAIYCGSKNQEIGKWIENEEYLGIDWNDIREFHEEATMDDVL